MVGYTRQDNNISNTMTQSNNPPGVLCGRRARSVSQKVFHANLGQPVIDEAELHKEVLHTVDTETWWPGEVLLVAASVPHETTEQLLTWLATFKVRKADLADAGTLHACEGSWFHEDSYAFANSFFCVMWLEEADPWDLLFPHSGIRIPLHKGTVVLFDPAHVHGVVARGKSSFQEDELGEHGVQAFASLPLRTSPRLMKLFEASWHPAAQAPLDLAWNQGSNPVCQMTGQLLQSQ